MNHEPLISKQIFGWNRIGLDWIVWAVVGRQINSIFMIRHFNVTLCPFEFSFHFIFGIGRDSQLFFFPIPFSGNLITNSVLITHSVWIEPITLCGCEHSHCLWNRWHIVRDFYRMFFPFSVPWCDVDLPLRALNIFTRRWGGKACVREKMYWKWMR